MKLEFVVRQSMQFGNKREKKMASFGALKVKCNRERSSREGWQSLKDW
jgi:hypothetical protein